MKWFGRMIHKIGREAYKLPESAGLIAMSVIIFGGIVGLPLLTDYLIPQIVLGALIFAAIVFVVALSRYEKTKRYIYEAIIAREIRQALSKVYKQPDWAQKIYSMDYDLKLLAEGYLPSYIFRAVTFSTMEHALENLEVEGMSKQDMEEELDYLLHLPNASRRLVKEVLVNYPPVFSPDEQKEIDTQKKQKEALEAREQERKQKKINAVPAYMDRVNQRYENLVNNWMAATENRSKAVSDLRDPDLLAFCGKMEKISALSNDTLRIAEFRHAVQDAEELWEGLNSKHPALTGYYS